MDVQLNSSTGLGAKEARRCWQRGRQSSPKRTGRIWSGSHKSRNTGTAEQEAQSKNAHRDAHEARGRQRIEARHVAQARVVVDEQIRTDRDLASNQSGTNGELQVPNLGAWNHGYRLHTNQRGRVP